jgi:hypothetical protein
MTEEDPVSEKLYLKSRKIKEINKQCSKIKKIVLIRETSGSHVGDYEDCYLMGCCAA